MALRPEQVSDPEWRAWLAAAPWPLQPDESDNLPKAVLSWLRQAPSTELLRRHEADELIDDFLLYSRHLHRAQRADVSNSGFVFVGAVVGLIGYAVGGPVGALAGPLFNFILAGPPPPASK
ncbi:MAG TPA: hypothetical protein VF547_11800 [Allosphingosinicella sp.]|jgi:hypothetical protein